MQTEIEKLESKIKKLEKVLRKRHKKIDKNWNWDDPAIYEDDRNYRKFWEDYQEKVYGDPRYGELKQLRLKLRLIQPYTLGTIGSYGDHMTIEKWLSCVRGGGFIDYDGFGYYATATHESDIKVYTSDYVDGEDQVPNSENIRGDFTHIVWYNR